MQALPPTLLTLDNAIGYLRSRGLVEPNARAELLGGGVSNVVIGVTDASTSLVVKQSLPKLRVEAVWTAPQDRVLTEAAALELAHELTPDRVPRVLDVDVDALTICLERAPADWIDWKSLLLRGRVETATATEVGRALARWHSETTDLVDPSGRMFHPTAFEQLRIDPYFRTVATREPTFAPALNDVIASLVENQRCLVHGDYSPKNMLVGTQPSDVWLIDFEVAHFGDPAFDLAFLLSHLVLKSIHSQDRRAALDACIHAFVAAYAEAVSAELAPDLGLVGRYVGALLLARVKGKSPVEYLDGVQQEQAWQLGGLALHDRDADLAALLAYRDQVVDQSTESL